MTTLRFGSLSANMLDPDFFGFGSWMTAFGEDVDAGAASITFRDLATGARFTLSGSFDYASESALFASPVNGMSLVTAEGFPLFDWSGLTLSLGEFLFLEDPAAIAEGLLAGDDAITGSPEADLLYGDLPTWHEESAIPSPVAIGEHLAMSADGSTLAGVVRREALPGDPGSLRTDVVLIDPATGVQRLMSLPDGDAVGGVEASNPSLSRDGRLLAFRTSDPAFGGQLDEPGFSRFQVVVRDTVTGDFSIVSASSAGALADRGCETPVISADGSTVVFASSARNLLDGVDLPYTGRQVYAKNLATGEVVLVSSDASGAPARADSFGAAVSADGRRVAFASTHADLDGDGIPADDVSVYLKDLETGQVIHVGSLGLRGYAPVPDMIGIAISLDGTTVAFSSAAALAPEDADTGYDVYVKEIDTGALRRVSVAEDGSAAPYGAGSTAVALSGDGAVVAFHARYGGFAAPWSAYTGNVYVADLSTSTITRVSAPNADNPSTPIALSADGLTLAFTQTVPGDAGAELVVASMHGQGADTIAGGGGDDLYFAETHDTVVELPGGGLDTLVTVWSGFALPDNTENLLYGGHGAFDGRGNAAANLITGGALGDALHGLEGDDTLAGGEGDDTLAGGPGSDHVRILSARADSAVERLGPYDFTVRGPDGEDTLTGVERLVFDDVALGFDVDGMGGKTFRLYKAAFDREPDPEGLGFWLHYLDRGFDMVEAADNFLNAEEFRLMYDGDPNSPGYQEPSNEQFCHLVYKHVLQREPDPEGYRFWVDAMVNKDGIYGHAWTRGEVLILFAESAENYGNTAELIGQGFAYVPLVE